MGKNLNVYVCAVHGRSLRQLVAYYHWLIVSETAQEAETLCRERLRDIPSFQEKGVVLWSATVHRLNAPQILRTLYETENPHLSEQEISDAVESGTLCFHLDQRHAQIDDDDMGFIN